MSTSSATGSRAALDWIKWILVIGVLSLGIFGNWYYQDESLLVRVAALIALAGGAFFLVIQTAKGRAAWDLLKEARSEIRRVVWPTWDETLQTTMIVLVLVLIFSLILWLLDSGLSWVVSSIIG